MVVGVALSDLVAFASSSTETNEMDKSLLALARKALRGEGHAYRRAHAHEIGQVDMETAQVGPNSCGSGSAAVAMVATNC